MLQYFNHTPGWVNQYCKIMWNPLWEGTKPSVTHSSPLCMICLFSKCTQLCVSRTMPLCYNITRAYLQFYGMISLCARPVYICMVIVLILLCIYHMYGPSPNKLLLLLLTIVLRILHNYHRTYRHTLYITYIGQSMLCIQGYNRVHSLTV